MVSVAVLVPRGGTCQHREAAWQWVRHRYATHHPHWQVVEGWSDPAAYSRSQAILDAFSRATADILVVADSDVWTDGTSEAVAHVTDTGWAIPHWLIHRLSKESTAKVLEGESWYGLPLSHDNKQDCRPYRGHETGTLVVLTRQVLEQVPPDPRFVQWGSEDDAWACALRALVGPPWRARHDIVHLWHPPQPRKSRTVGTVENRALLRRYQLARRNQAAMGALIAEVTWPASSSTSSPVNPSPPPNGT